MAGHGRAVRLPPGLPARRRPTSTRFAALGAAEVVSTDDPRAAVEGAHVVVTDAWYSMGQEAEASERRPVFEPFRVDDALMSGVADDAIFLHCLPAHRGEEVTNSVLDGPRSRVWPEAANRLAAARGAIEWLVERSLAGPDGSGS
jgi:ornithine carbamoyltransferase